MSTIRVDTNWRLWHQAIGVGLHLVVPPLSAYNNRSGLQHRRNRHNVVMHHGSMDSVWISILVLLGIGLGIDCGARGQHFPVVAVLTFSLSADTFRH